MIFEGWVPNATGNLSFSAFGDSLGGRVRARQHYWRPHARWVACAQDRVNQDRQVPAAVVRLLDSLAVASGSGATLWDRLTYVVTCRSIQTGSDLEGALQGEIAILRPPAGRGDGIATVAAMASRLQQASRAYRDLLPHDPPDADLWCRDQASIRRASIFCVKFTLLRNGKCFFEIDKEEGGADPHEWLVSQCYYFLKDAIHQHYHHKSSTDAIIEVNEAGNGQEWRLRTVRNLYRKVISLRRYFDEGHLSDALGVLAYARAFSGIFASYDFDRDGICSPADALPSYEQDIKDSIAIRKETVAKSRERRRVDAQYVLGTIVAIGALYVSIFEHFNKLSVSYKIGASIVEYLSQSPVLFLIVPALGYVWFILYTGRLDPADFTSVRRLYRLLAWIPRPVLVYMLAAATAVLLIASATAFWNSYRSAEMANALLHRRTLTAHAHVTHTSPGEHGSSDKAATNAAK